jgi:GAF domain-containing protein
MPRRRLSDDSSSGLRGTSEALHQLGTIALREQSMDSLLQAVVDLAKGVLPGAAEVSVSVIAAGQASSPVSTGQLARDCDELQYDRGSGPCLHAATSRELTEIADTLAESRWADYCRRAAEHGARGSLSVPLPMSDELAGALNIYVREPDAFDDDVRAAAVKFAPYAAVAVANERAYDDARNMADNLTLALENRAVIDQAKGILMERYGLGPEQAFDTLARISRASSRKLRAVAEVLVRTGELPGVPLPPHRT